MLARIWFQKNKAARFLTATDEWTVYYPFGPFRGYLLQNSLVDRCARTVGWCELISIVGVWMTLWGMHSIFNFDFTTTIAVGVMETVVFNALWIRWTTNGLQSLPCRMSVRTYAAFRDPQLLFEQCLFSSLAAAVTVLLAIVGHLRILWTILAIAFLSIALIAAYVSYIRRRLDSSQPSLNGIEHVAVD